METLSSSFLATPLVFPPHHSSDLNYVSSSFRFSAKSPHHQPNYFNPNSFTLIFNPINKLLNHTAQTLKSKQPVAQKIINKKQSSSLASIFQTLDDLVCNFLDLPLRPSIDPKYVLSGNFAPVDELPPTPCEVVEASLPSCLDGAYIRNGPNPRFIPPGPYHLFDGDGMLHMIRISRGEATFCSRYVKTYKQFNPIRHGFGVANTSLALFAGHLFALCESDIPYEIKVTPDGDIVTIGRHDFQRSSRECSSE
ncbi:UNVERIFIED_CONTAM: putative carotenoid cleavage dioxygenase 4, chloroplastic [Sesamum radiatum]|uniref:Carotenoid cleavage dioxygenase 4, chloroplastic n=1 Tax=Sesamum radiatum TaxID=300843 RepID=A0AAW2JTF5_SESRA